MKPLSVIISLLFLSLLTGCEAESVPSIQESTAGHILSRSNDTELLPAESQILLNAHGGMTIENQAFKFDGNTWSDGNEYKWEDTQKPTYITALYPLFENKQYTAANLYDESGLKDILIAQDTISENTGVELTFKHLFASFTLKAEESLADDIQAISLTIPKSVESISPTTGSITLSNTSHTTTGLKDENGNYTFVIPPMEGRLKLHITQTDNTEPFLHELAYHKFESGFKYECRLRDKNTVPGIRTVNEFIEFCTIINEGTGDLSKYGEEKDGKMLYRLLADIDLEKITLSPIGKGKPFIDIFDGGGHTITNLTLEASDGAAGLFYNLGSGGKIQNLYLDYCTMDIPENASASSGVGSIAGVCAGIISNCGVTNGSITNKKNSYTGGIVGTLRDGIIINSFIKDTQVISTDASVGGFAGRIETGNIINCYSASNTITRNKNYCGGFCGFADNGNIINCYVYKSTFKNSTNTGQFIGKGENSNVSYCYTNTSSLTLIGENVNTTSTVSSSKTYNSSTFMINELHIVNVLNQWITNNQSSYENYTFTTWKKDTSGKLPAIFK